MCGRYAFLLPHESWRGLFKVLNDFAYVPRYNVTPTQPIVTILEREGRRTAELFRWGFVPNWVKDPREFPLLINARGETMADKPAFRNAVRNARCVVPANGYFEWMKAPGGKRRPYYITTVDDQPMVFAGLYSTWAGPNGEEVDTVCIVTVDPNLEISGIYDRMPAILHGAAVDAWLNTRDVDTAEAMALAVTPPPGTMKYHPVGRAIGNAINEGPELIVPIDPDAEDEAPPAKPRKKAAGGGQLDLF
jgi:putative SOS response-associated peptidase YedK